MFHRLAISELGILFDKPALPSGLLHAQVSQDLGFFFPCRQNFMARGTIMGDGFAVGAGMTAVMAAEAAR